MKKLKFLALFGIILIFINTNMISALDLNQKIKKNVYVDTVDLSGLTMQEAQERLENHLNLSSYFNLVYEDKNIKVDKNDFDVDYKINELVNKAYNVGRDKDLISNIKTNISLGKGNKEIININPSYNGNKIDQFIKNLDREIYIKPVNATAKVVNGHIIFTKELDGKEVDSNQLKEIILYRIKKIKSEDVTLPTNTIKPKFTLEQLSKINTILGTYQTSFNIKNEERVNNIDVASKSVSNIILGKNEKLFFNSFLECEAVKKQFKEAPIIKNGKTDKGMGGGVCQVSSTLYNAALYAGMKIVKVQNHSIPSFYIEKGRDATVSDGYIDFIFENKYDTPVLVYNEVVGDKIISTIYGNQEDKKDIEIVTDVISVKKNKEIIKKDPKLPKGSKIVEQEGRLGYTVNTFRIYKKQDEILKKELVYTSYYPPSDRIIVEGSKEMILQK